MWGGCHHLLSVSGEPLLSDGGEGHTHNCSLYHLCPKNASFESVTVVFAGGMQAFPSALSSALRVTQVLEKALMMACLRLTVT